MNYHLLKKAGFQKQGRIHDDDVYSCTITEGPNKFGIEVMPLKGSRFVLIIWRYYLGEEKRISLGSYEDLSVVYEMLEILKQSIEKTTVQSFKTLLDIPAD